MKNPKSYTKDLEFKDIDEYKNLKSQTTKRKVKPTSDELEEALEYYGMTIEDLIY